MKCSKRSTAVIQNRFGRSFVFLLGIVALALGIVGAFLPLLPTTPFLILAATCFVNSSPKVHAWLLRQPVIGDALINWQRSKSISRSNKVQALIMMAVSLIFIWIKVPQLWVCLLVTTMLMAVAGFIISRPEN